MPAKTATCFIGHFAAGVAGPAPASIVALAWEAQLMWIFVVLGFCAAHNRIKRRRTDFKNSNTTVTYIQKNMANLSGKTRQLILIAGSIIGWIALISQLYLIISNRITSLPETIMRFFGFFTILTNILVALCFSSLLVKPRSKPGNFFTRPSTLTATAGYIAVVGIIYNTILRFLWSPTGLQFLVDELLHSAIPALFIGYWIIFVPKNELQWKDIFLWLGYPATYCVYSLLRGAISGFYPYPFIDVNLLGYNKVFINIGGLIILFLVISTILVGIAKLINSKGGG